MKSLIISSQVGTNWKGHSRSSACFFLPQQVLILKAILNKQPPCQTLSWSLENLIYNKIMPFQILIWATVAQVQCGSCLRLLIIHSLLVTCPFSLNLQPRTQTPFREIIKVKDQVSQPERCMEVKRKGCLFFYCIRSILGVMTR